MSFSKVGIVGTGIIGEALIEVLLRSGLSKKSLFIAEKRQERRDEIIATFGVSEILNYGSLDAILLAVKPQDFIATLETISDSLSGLPLFVSFAGEDQIKVLHLPGHSRGHLGVLDVKTRTLLISDAVLGSYVPYADGSPSFPPTYRFVKSYLQTIQRLLLLDFDSLGTAHYGTFSRQGGLRFLQESHDFALALETTIEGAIGNEPKTLPEIVEFVDSSTGLWPKPSSPAALAQPVFGHLEFLEEKEVIQRVKGSEIGWIKLR